MMYEATRCVVHQLKQSSSPGNKRLSVMPSAVDVAKRALVKVLKELAAKYQVALSVNRESADKDVTKGYRKVCLKVHPDKGGDVADFKKLSAANDAWQDLLLGKAGPGRPAKQEQPERPQPWVMAVATEPKVFSVRGQAVLLTYQSFASDLVVFLPVWRRFVAFVVARLKEWGVRHWTATAETNEDATHHFHLMLQFFQAGKRVSSLYAFEEVLPNASANDLLGEGMGGNRFNLGSLLS